MPVTRLRTRSPLKFAAAATGLVCAGLSLIPVVLALGDRPPMAVGIALEYSWRFVQAVPLALPFSVLVGAAILARTPARRARSALVLLALAASLTFAAGAVVAPRLEYVIATRRAPTDVASRYPFGPDTPANLARLAAFVREHPPEEYSLSTDHPTRTPPNWLDYLRQMPGVLAVLAVLNGLLGWLVACRLRARSGRYVRWLLWTGGLAAAVGFMALQGVAGAMVRGDLATSGGLLAWAPLLPWVAAIAFASGRGWARTQAKGPAE